MSPKGKGDLPKGDVTLQAYLVKWVTRIRVGPKFLKICFCHSWTHREKYAWTVPSRKY